MKRLFVLLLLGSILVPSVSFAQTSYQPTNQQLQQLIAALTLRVQMLESQLASLTGTHTVNTPKLKQDDWTSCKISDENYRNELADLEKGAAQEEFDIFQSSKSDKSKYSAITKLRKELAADTKDMQDRHGDLVKECKSKGVRLEKLNVGQYSSTCSYTLDKKGKLLRQCA